MKSLARFTLGVLLFGSVVPLAQAAFTSLYVFGDGACTTTNTPVSPYYHGGRYCNGRIWVEVLAQWQGLPYESNKNVSYFAHDSGFLVTNVNNFAAPPDAATALFAIWVIDADFVWNITQYGTNRVQWTNAMNLSLSNHFKAITNLYAKGARTFVLPTAVDISNVPAYDGSPPANKTFIRQRIIEFNASFVTMLNQLKTSLTNNITIHVPDLFTLMDTIMAHPSDYGLIDAREEGVRLGAIFDQTLVPLSFTGPGANYIFWDDMHPTSKAHMRLAEHVQQLISPVNISAVAPLGSSNRLTVANIPVGRNGFVDGSTNLLQWTEAVPVTSTNTTQMILVPAQGASQFHRLRFPFSWTWP